MSDDERYYREVDLESMIDDDNEDGKWKIDDHGVNEAERRAHHNALERKRRDHIKDSFVNLRDAVPSFQGDKGKASRAQILKKAADYIQLMRKRQASHLKDIDDLKRQNNLLEAQIRMLEKSRPLANNFPHEVDDEDDDGTSSSNSERELHVDDQVESPNADVGGFPV